MAGFGGVAEYGITVRWDKNFLTLLHLTLARRRGLTMFGGIRFGGRQLFGEAQRLVAQDAVAAFLYQPQWITVARAGLRGLWQDTPLFANDLAALSWG